MIDVVGAECVVEGMVVKFVTVHVGLLKFDPTREHDTNPTRFLWVWVKYNRVWVIFVLTRLTRLINGPYSYSFA